MPAPKISVVIPTFGQTVLDRTLDALCRQTVADGPVIVVENGPVEPATRSMVLGYRDRLDLRMVRCEPHGLNQARNAGASLATSPLIAFTDDDCVPHEDWLAALIECHEAFPRCGVAGGRVLLKDAGSIPSWTYPFENLLSLIDWGTDNRPLGKGEWIAGANLCFKRDYFERAGGFAASIGMSGRGAPQLGNDEIECVSRVAELGKPGLVYAGSAAVDHLIPASRRTVEYLEQRNYGQGISDVDQLVLHFEEDVKQSSAVIGKIRYNLKRHHAAIVVVCGDDAAHGQDMVRSLRTMLAYYLGVVDRLAVVVAQTGSGTGAGDRIGARSGRLALLLEKHLESWRMSPPRIAAFTIPDHWSRLTPQASLARLAIRIELLGGAMDALLGRERPYFRDNRPPETPPTEGHLAMTDVT